MVFEDANSAPQMLRSAALGNISVTFLKEFSKSDNI